ncbi:MAG: hypothetical protein JSW36_01405 [Burkholderiales bacterium]|nr:MAG: hypothetical protein JSW36_01405 [Burkholderiales bacterium]
MVGELSMAAINPNRAQRRCMQQDHGAMVFDLDGTGPARCAVAPSYSCRL